MIKKQFNQLYAEVTQIRRKLDNGKLKYFGKKDFGNAESYTVMLKDGSYFFVSLGSTTIPEFRKKDVAFIGKMHICDSTMPNWGSFVDYTDSDRGTTRYSWDTAHIEIRDFENTRFRKYRISIYSEKYTGAWD